MNGKPVITYPCQSLCPAPLRGMVATAKGALLMAGYFNRSSPQRPGSSKQKVL
jgi:hypothetical protein